MPDFFDKYAMPQIDLWSALRREVLERNRHSPRELPFIVGIGGAGCTGKSHFASELVSYPKPEHSVMFDLDGYLIEQDQRDENKLTGYNPLSYKYDEAVNAFISLLTQEHTTIKRYNHLTRQHYEVEITNCPKRTTIIVVGVGANTLHFSPSKLFSLCINFLPDSDDAYKQARFTVETESRRRTIKIEDWPERLNRHLNDFRRFIDTPSLRSHIDVVVQRVSNYEWPFLSEVRTRHNTTTVIQKPNVYSIEQSAHGLQPETVAQFQAALNLLPAQNEATQKFREELSDDITTIVRGSLSKGQIKNVVKKIDTLLSKENLERGTLLFKLIRGVGDILSGNPVSSD